MILGLQLGLNNIYACKKNLKENYFKATGA